MRTSNICPTCSTFINAKCVLYNGPLLETLNIPNLTDVEIALQKIEEWASGVVTDVNLTNVAFTNQPNNFSVDQLFDENLYIVSFAQNIVGLEAIEGGSSGIGKVFVSNTTNSAGLELLGGGILKFLSSNSFNAELKWLTTPSRNISVLIPDSTETNNIIPFRFTDGTNTVEADNNGLVDLSSLVTSSGGSTPTPSLQQVIEVNNTYINGDDVWEWREDEITFTNNSLKQKLVIKGDQVQFVDPLTNSSDGLSGIKQTEVIIGNGSNSTIIKNSNVLLSRTLQLPSTFTNDRILTVGITDGFNTVYTNNNGIIDLSSLSFANDLLFTSSNIITDTNLLEDFIGGMNEVDSGSNITITVQPNISINLPVGTIVAFRQKGDGNIIINYAAGVTGDAGQTYRKGDTLSLWQESVDNWVILNPPTALDSYTDGEPTGSDQVFNIVSLTQADYDAAVLAGQTIPTTFYVIPQ